ncbi:hypothetical protein E3P92_03695 [Wallemia ichthyophaga]|uniref:SDE2-like domain-containing protein n=2 Tax=Wallemia ichthyophaga TaxID=245174 RepID=A0A4T0JY57_WALIC|nr:UPF0667 family protein C31G5.18c [Wallemia ichthyophaga EXF-994]TIA71238.1 hypothetical protein E3P91_02632 [Wallemia ichthyophaga]EOQ98972.1 UPF0667 family protein C31G5.18c [Wallemia ichthyophaga EXF-994]TIA78672.1 hypothetical protein E3P98_03709 [Wallemia ichthyophaga]TIA87785.1 hypothetical protein E3P97_03790 [Wallemia ichthyophaga]TIA95448.1 hypothetical protein E3P95_03694 [Wallemia ichthyophaga]
MYNIFFNKNENVRVEDGSLKLTDIIGSSSEDFKCSSDINQSVAKLCGEFNFIDISVSPRMLGGKGGFGAQLRSAGGKMRSNRNNNTDACRDLSGRRISTLKEAQKVAEYMESSEEREKKQKQEEKDKLEAMEKKYNQQPQKRRLDDDKYLEQNKDMNDNVRSSVAKGLLAKRRKKQPSTENAEAGSSRNPFPSKLAEESSQSVPASA